MNDQDIISKVCKLSAWIWVVAATCALILHRPWTAASITLGMALSAGILMFSDFLVRRSFNRGAKRSIRILWLIAFVKYPLLFGTLYVLVSSKKIDILAFCGGVVLVHLAIVIAAIVNLRAEQRNMSKSDVARAQDRET